MQLGWMCACVRCQTVRRIAAGGLSQTMDAFAFSSPLEMQTRPPKPRDPERKVGNTLESGYPPTASRWRKRRLASRQRLEIGSPGPEEGRSERERNKEKENENKDREWLEMHRINWPRESRGKAFLREQSVPSKAGPGQDDTFGCAPVAARLDRCCRKDKRSLSLSKTALPRQRDCCLLKTAC